MPATVVVARNSFANALQITGTSTPTASTTAVIGSTLTGLDPFRSLTLECVFQGATGGTLDLYLQVSPNGGTSYVDYAHFTQLAAGAGTVTYLLTVSREQQSNNQTSGSGTVVASPAIATVGSNLTPVFGGANMAVIGGDFGDRLRLIGKSGAGTSAGATQTVNIVGVS